jgi:6,7-dimethyl-8-ribityllumazine synthase
VLTVENYEQALARVGEKRHQGVDAARAVLALAQIKSALDSA